MTSKDEPFAVCASSYCRGPIMTWNEAYRCTECDGLFHRDCLGPKHSPGWKAVHPRVSELEAKIADAGTYLVFLDQTNEKLKAALHRIRQWAATHTEVGSIGTIESMAAEALGGAAHVEPPCDPHPKSQQVIDAISDLECWGQAGHIKLSRAREISKLLEELEA